jgi:hypothetical protein
MGSHANNEIEKKMSATSSRAVVGASLRYKVTPRDVPPTKAARRLHLTLVEFNRVLPELRRRGFPPADPTTGNYDLAAIERWMDARSGLAEPLTDETKPRDPAQSFRERVARLANGSR